MKKVLKRPLSIILAVLMVVSLFVAVPVTASAAENCLTFTGKTQFTLTGTGILTSKVNLEYSTDATTWTAWDKSAISSTDTTPYVLYLRGKRNTRIQGGTNGLILSAPAACSGKHAA